MLFKTKPKIDGKYIYIGGLEQMYPTTIIKNEKYKCEYKLSIVRISILNSDNEMYSIQLSIPMFETHFKEYNKTIKERLTKLIKNAKRRI